MPRILLVIPAVVLAVAASGCGGSDDESTATTVAPVIATLPRIELPDSFPDEVPIPAGIQLEEANELVSEASTIYDVTGWNAGEPVPLGEAYLAELRDSGFEITSRIDAVTSILFTVEGTDWFVSAGFYPDAVKETGTSIGLTVGPLTP